MKKLALVLGSLLVVGSVASAKEVMPAPAAAPEVVVKVVEKPVVVYKEKEAAWKPNGQVEVSLKTKGDTRGKEKMEAHSMKIKEKGWNKVELKTKGNVQFTPKQNLAFEYTDNLGYNTRRDSDVKSATTSHGKTKLTHTYKFNDMMRLESQFSVSEGFKLVGQTEDEMNAIIKHLNAVNKTNTPEVKFDKAGRRIRERFVYDFSNYFFKNDYVKATALELGPEYSYTWSHVGHDNHFGLYANAKFELPYGVTFQAEFDDLFAYDRVKLYKGNNRFSVKSTNLELTLGKDFVYANGPHKLTAGLEGKYETGVIWNKIKYGNEEIKRVPTHTFTFEPSLKYEFKATDYVTLWSKVGTELKYERSKFFKEGPRRKTRTAQPYAEVGFKTTF